MKSRFLLLIFVYLHFLQLSSKAQNLHYHLNPSLLYFDKPVALQNAGISNVRCVYKDSRGFMWFGTENGLYRFDGTNVVYTHHINGDTSSIASNDILSILEDYSGNLWVGTTEGGFILNASTFKSRRIKDANNNFLGFKMSFFTKDKKTVWAATDDGLYRYNFATETLDKVWDGRNKGKGTGFAVTSISFYTKDTLVLGTLSGVVFLNPQNFNFREIPFYQNGRPIKLITSTTSVDDDGELWVGTWRYGLLHYNRNLDNFSNYTWQKDVSNGLSNVVNSIITVKTGITKVLYVGCAEGVFEMPLVQGTSQVDEKNIGLFAHNDKIPNGISAGAIRNFYKDDLQQLWVSLSGDFGVNKISVYKSMFTALPLKRNGFVQQNQSIRLGGKQYFCISSWHGFPALQILDSALQPVKTFMHVPEDDANPDAGNASSVAVDNHDRLWVSSWRGIVIMDKNFRTVKIINHRSGTDTLSRDKNNYLLISGDSVWIASYKNGLDLFNTNFKRLGHIALNEQGLSEDLIWKLFKDKQGTIWLLGNAFLHRFNPVTHQFKQYYFSNDGTVPSPADIAEKKDGTLLVATKNGLVHFNPQTEKYNYIRCPFLQKEDNITAVCTDDNDNAWFTTASHLVKFDFSTQNFILYGKEDGLDIEDNLMSVRLIGRNKFIVSQQAAFTMFTPGPPGDNTNVPKVVITQAIVNDSSITLTDDPVSLRLLYNQNRVSFNFCAINYIRPEQNKFAYRLKSSDTAWTSTFNGSVSYANLAPGSYLFEVKVENYAGVWSKVQSVSIIISPPFWKTWWFISLAILFISGLFYSVVRYVTYRNLKEKILGLEKEQALEKERNRISRDMHDDLGSGLTKIAILTEVIKTQPSSLDKNINKISETARALVDNLDEMVWALNPGNDSFDKLAAYIAEYTQQYLEGSGIESFIELPALLNPVPVSEEKRRNIFMAVKEFLNNTVKHSKATKVSLQIFQLGAELQIVVKDNGRGIEQTKRNGLGNGLQNMQQRIEDIGGNFILLSEPDKGTEMNITCRL